MSLSDNYNGKILVKCTLENGHVITFEVQSNRKPGESIKACIKRMCEEASK